MLKFNGYSHPNTDAIFVILNHESNIILPIVLFHDAVHSIGRSMFYPNLDKWNCILYWRYLHIIAKYNCVQKQDNIRILLEILLIAVDYTLRRIKSRIISRGDFCSDLRIIFVLIFTSSYSFSIQNDPSAGSPTDAVLRLLHPLDNKAHNTFLKLY